MSDEQVANDALFPETGKSSPSGVVSNDVLFKGSNEPPPPPEKYIPSSPAKEFMHGLTGGWSDKYNAGVSTLVNRFQGDQTPYADTLAATERGSEAYHKENPVTSSLARGTGMAAPMLAGPLAASVRGAAAVPSLASEAWAFGKEAPKFLTRAYEGAKGGALWGGITGGGETPGTDPMAIANNTGKGAGLGAGIGTVLSPAIGAVSDGARLVKSAFGTAKEKMQNAIDRAIGRDGGMGALPTTANGIGQPMTLADVGGTNVQRLADKVITQSGPGAATGTAFLEGRQTGSQQRVINATRAFLSPTMDAHAAATELKATQKALSDPLYDAAMAKEGVWNARIERFIQQPELKQGIKEGVADVRREALADNKPFDPTAMGIDLDAEGNVKLLRVPAMRVLDAAKRGLDGMIAKAVAAGDNAYARSLIKLKKSFVSELDTLNPKYAEARKVFSDHAQSQRSIDEGLTFLQQKGVNADAAIERFHSLDPADQAFFRVGLARSIKSATQQGGVGDNAVKRFFNSAENRDKLKPIFSTDAAYNVFSEAMDREAKMTTTRNRLLRGSQTGSRMADAAEDHAGPLEFAEDAAHLAAGHTGIGLFAIKKMLARAGNSLNRFDDATSAELARVLFNPDSKVVTKELEDIANRRFAERHRGDQRTAVAKALPLPAIGYVGQGVGVSDQPLPMLPTPADRREPEMRAAEEMASPPANADMRAPAPLRIEIRPDAAKERVLAKLQALQE